MSKNERVRRWQKRNADRERARKRRDYHADPDKKIADVLERRATKDVIRATPAWAGPGIIDVMEGKCQELRRKYPQYDFRIAHMIPLRGRIVCGLHVSENLRIVSKSLAESLNRYDRIAQEVAYMRWLVERGL